MYNSILVPIDLLDEASWKNVLPIAIEEARNSDAKLCLVAALDINLGIAAPHLGDNFNAKQLEHGKERLEKVAKEHIPDDVNVQCVVRDGRPYREILEVASDVDADLIIMASHRPSLGSFLLGANAAKVVRHAKCSVLVVR